MPDPIVRTETPSDVIGWVAADLLSLQEEERPFQRYIWIPSWSPIETNHAVTFAVNTTISRSGTIRHPVVVANGRLQRWDLRLLLPDEPTRLKLTEEVDKVFAADPYFRDATTGEPDILVAEKLIPLSTAIVGAPVMRADRFVFLSLSSIEGGRYLELRGLADVKPIEGRTPEEEVLARVGVFEKVAVGLDGDRRVGMFRSGVTGKARAVVALNTLVGRAWTTEDIFDEDADEDAHPVYSLLDMQYRGREIIAEMQNGLHLFLITDDQGRILREAPPQLVTDSRVPPPNTARLQGGAISCIRCHGTEDGLRSCVNDVAKLLSGPLELNGDDKFRDDVTTRYSGRDFERHISLGRESYAAAIDELTFGELDVTALSALVSDTYARYRYDMVTPFDALNELGFGLDPEMGELDPVAVLREVLSFDIGIGDIGPNEDPAIAALASGIAIRRFDFERVHSRLAFRVAAVRSRLKQDYPKE